MKWFLNQELKTLLDFLSNPGSGNLQQDGKELLQLTGHGVPLLASAMNYDELVSLANDADMDVTPGPRPNARDPSRCDPDESSRNLVVSANGESGVSAIPFFSLRPALYFPQHFLCQWHLQTPMVVLQVSLSLSLSEFYRRGLVLVKTHNTLSSSKTPALADQSNHFSTLKLQPRSKLPSLQITFTSQT